jgi:hypothetical protein
MIAIRVLAVLVAFALGACSGQPTAGPLPSSETGSIPNKAAGSAKASIRIHVPRRTRRRSHYVSPSTQSASIAVSPAAGCSRCTAAFNLNVALTQNSPNCTNASGGLNCIISFTLLPGKYVASIDTYDGPLDAHNDPTGTLLSLKQAFPITIAAGKANVPTITLDGVPAGIVFFNLTKSLVIGTVPNSGFQDTFQMVGPGSHALAYVYATDPDGNVILGAGGPSFTVSAGGGFAGSVTGNTLSLTAPSPAVAGSFAFVVSALSPACAQTAAICTPGSRTIGFDPLIAVALLGTNRVLLYGAFSGIAYATISTGVVYPADLKFDGSGDLFVANKQGNTVTEYAPPYSGAPILTISNGVAGPTGLAFSSDFSLLAVANGGSGNTTLYTKPFTGAPQSIPQVASALAFDSSANLWLAAGPPANDVTRYRASSSYVTYDVQVTNGIDQPASIAFDVDSNLVVANSGAGTVTTYDASSIPPYNLAPGQIASLTGVSSLAMAAAYRKFAACYQGEVGIYYQNSVVTQYSSSQTPCQATFDQNFDLWVTQPDSQDIVGHSSTSPNTDTFSTGAGSDPGAIAAFPPFSVMSANARQKRP